MSALKKVAIYLVAAPSLMLLSGCGEDDAPRAHTLEISDVSLSGLRQGARLDAVAKNSSLTAVGALKPGDALTVYAFGATLTSACEPITADYARQGNDEEQDQLKKVLVAALPGAYDEYVTCVRDTASGGSSEPGSPIFGAIVEALMRARATAPVTYIDLTTDGCSFGEGVRTCAKGMTRPKYADKLIENMPARLLPNLRGITLRVTGLGQGTGMSSEQVSVLRAVFTAYGSATGSTVEFG